MKTSERGLQLIKDAEGLRLKAYRCSANVLTIGYGVTSATGLIDIKPDTTITKAQADELLKRALKLYESCINESVIVPLKQSQFDCLVSFCYNIGCGAFKKSTLRKELNKGNYDAVPTELMKWTKAGGKRVQGLVNRRTKEAALWAEDDWEADEEPSNNVVVSRDVPTFINTENVTAAGALVSGVGASNLDGTNPISWALAIVAVMTAAVFLYLFIKRRGA